MRPVAAQGRLGGFPLAVAALMLTIAFSAMSADPTPSFSARLDALWDYSRLAESEARFRAELAAHPAGSREALETSTQIARTQSLRRQFADATLDAITPKLDWNRKALAAAEASADARARGWAAFLNDSIGWTYFDKGTAR